MYLHERENWTDFTWDERVVAPLLGNARFAQGKLLGRLEDVGFDLSREIEVGSLLAGDFEGKLTAKKWAKLCKVSPDTALRDINDLIAKGVLERNAAGGRSTSYSLR